MSDSADSLANWVIGSVAAGVLALVGFLSKFVFGGVLKRLDEIKTENDAANRDQLTEIRAIAVTQQAQTTAQAIMELKISTLQAQFASFHDTQKQFEGFLVSRGYKRSDGR